MVVAVPLIAEGGSSIDKVEDAIEIINTFSATSDDGIPSSLLSDARGIAIIPGVIKVGFIIGGNYGKGILSIKDRSGHWTNPAFITMTGGSIGWQIGAQSSDIILVFNTQRSIDNITAGKFTLGGDASVAAGPVGRGATANTDIEMNAEIYSYSRTRGLFAGVSIQGCAIEIDYDGIFDFYGNPRIGAKDIFEDSSIKAPDIASDFKRVLMTQAQP